MARFSTFNQNKFEDTPQWRKDNYAYIDGNMSNLVHSIPVDEKKLVLTKVAKKLEGLQYQIGIAIKHVCM